MLKAVGSKCLNQIYDKLLSSFGFKFNVRHYNQAVITALNAGAAATTDADRTAHLATVRNQIKVIYAQARAYPRPPVSST
jgi:hypothetical protein